MSNIAQKITIIDATPMVADDPPNPFYHINQGGIYGPTGKYMKAGKALAVKEFYASEEFPNLPGRREDGIWIGASLFIISLRDYLSQEVPGSGGRLTFKENPFIPECQLLKKIIRVGINERWSESVPTYLSYVSGHPFEKEFPIDRNDPRWPAHLFAINEDGTCGVFIRVNIPEDSGVPGLSLP